MDDSKLSTFFKPKLWCFIRPKIWNISEVGKKILFRLDSTVYGAILDQLHAPLGSVYNQGRHLRISVHIFPHLTQSKLFEYPAKFGNTVHNCFLACSWFQIADSFRARRLEHAGLSIAGPRTHYAQPWCGDERTEKELRNGKPPTHFEVNWSWKLNFNLVEEPWITCDHFVISNFHWNQRDIVTQCGNIPYVLTRLLGVSSNVSILYDQL